MTDPLKQVAVRKDPGVVAVTAGEGGRRKKPPQTALVEEEFTEVSSSVIYHIRKLAPDQCERGRGFTTHQLLPRKVFPESLVSLSQEKALLACLLPIILPQNIYLKRCGYWSGRIPVVPTGNKLVPSPNPDLANVTLSNRRRSDWYEQIT